MGRSRCCVPGCKSTDVTVHRFPKLTEKAIFKEWIKRICHPTLSTLEHKKVYQSYCVCDNHFLQCCRSPGQNRLKPYSLPTLNLPGKIIYCFRENKTITYLKKTCQ